MAVFTLTMVRHGETSANKERIIQGQKDTPLSSTGLRQAELVAKRLQHERFTHVYASDLKRALQTCQTIMDRNLVTKCPLKQDERLRERKFGQFEGFPITEFINAAKQSSKKLADFRPPGAEDLSQVKARAVLFFQDLCQQLQVLALSPSATTRGEGGEPINNKKRPHTGSICSVGSVSEVFSPEGANILSAEDSIDESQEQEELSRSDKARILSDSTSGYSSCSADLSDQMSPVLFQSHDLNSPSHQTSPNNVGSTRGTGANNNNGNNVDSSSTYTALPSVGASHELSGGSETPAVSASWNWPYSCPNVSLSPLIEHRVSSISSISSGRNNSFDDFDTFPVLVAEVLVVSHGGLLKELVRHFVHDLGCHIPGGESQIMRVSPNTGLSKFTISLLEEDGRPRVNCLLLHDKDHLMNSGLEPLNVSIYSESEEASP